MGGRVGRMVGITVEVSVGVVIVVGMTVGDVGTALPGG